MFKHTLKAQIYETASKIIMNNINHPNLDPNFLPKSPWEEHSFESPETKRNIVYYSMISDENNKNLLIAPGLSEFGEKYFETAQFFFERGYNIFIIDWAYQGKSTRLQSNPHKRHSDGYDKDLLDVHFLITTFIGNSKPFYILGHSMGAHISLRYVSEFDHFVKAISCSAPMLQIKSLRLRQKLLLNILKYLHLFEKSYIPGGKNWNKLDRNEKIVCVYSNDPKRKKIHREWSIFDKKLRLGSPTIKWVRESLYSITTLKSNYSKITTPILLGLAEDELIVENEAIIRAAELIPNAKLTKFKNAKHEILMEKDNIRDKFLEETLKLFDKS